MQVFMPKMFDDEAWRSTPSEWLPELRERNVLGNGEVEFFVADILGTQHVDLERDGSHGIVMPAGTNFVVCAIDGDPSDQGVTVDDIVDRMRTHMADWDWPMSCTFVFWRHHDEVQSIKLTS